MKIRLAGTVEESIVDGPGLRFTVFVQGCDHKCKGCHNPETWPFKKGSLRSIESILKDIHSNPLNKAVTFSGGDPLYQSEACTELASILKEEGYNIWVYTGFTWEEVKDDPLMKYTDVLVDGPFVESLKSYELRFRGSSNQRLIDVQESLKKGEVVLHKTR